MDHAINGFSRSDKRVQPIDISWAQLRPRVRPPAAILLALGIVVAIATDGDLPMLVSKGLFGVLFLLNLVVIDWLIEK